MVRRAAFIILESLGATLAGLALVFGFLVWRLTQEGPIHLRFLSPYIEQALQQGDQPFRIAIEDTVLAWKGWDRTLDVSAVNLHVRDADGRELATLPEVSITFSARALLKGFIAPSRIEIIGASLSLTREMDGSLVFGPQTIGPQELETQGLETQGLETQTLGAQEPAAPSSDGSAALLLLAREMLNPPDPLRPSGYIRSAAILNGSLQVIDKITGLTWQAEGLGAEARRSAVGLTGDFFAALPQFGDPAVLSASLTYGPGTRTLGVEATIGGLNLAALGLIEPALADLSTSDMTVTAHANTTISFDERNLGRVAPLDFRLESGHGMVDLPDVLTSPVAVANIRAEGRLDRTGDVISLKSLDLDLGGPKVSISADWQGAFSGRARDGGLPRLKATLGLRQLPVKLMQTYWPEKVAPNTREWVIPNITDGMVDDVAIDLALRMPSEIAESRLEEISGSLKTSGLTVHYLRPLPPIVDGVAEATFGNHKFSAKIVSGRVGDIAVKSGALFITGLDREDQFIKVGGDVEGPLGAALALLDDPTLGYAAKLGIDPGTTEGMAKASLLFDFPAARNLTFDQVKLKVVGEMTGVKVAKIRFGQDVSDGSLALDLDEQGMSVRGPVVFGGIPLSLDWRQNFTDQSGFAERLHVSGRADADQRAALDFDYRPWLDGPSVGDIVYTRLFDDRATIEGKLDLLDSVIDLPFLKWRKAAGVPGGAAFRLDLRGGKLASLSQFSIQAADLVAAGRGEFGADGSLQRVDLPELQVGRSHLKGFEAEFKAGWVLVSVAGGTLDAEPWLERRNEPLSAEELARIGPEPSRPFTLQGSLNALRLGEGRELTDVSLDAVHDPLWWDRIVFEAALPGGTPISFNYRPAGEAEHALSITTEDGGEALRVLDLFNSVKGGTLAITGTVKDNESWRPLKGKIAMSSFRLINTPFIARFLSVASLTGVIDVVTGEGFLFAGAEGRFTKNRGLINVKRFRSAGPSIGFTSQGQIDLDRGTVDLKGTIVPAYAINSVLGNIPLIGPLITGGEGEGLFSATYSIAGDLSEPKIEVNEWSALAPGFIRDLFTDGGNIDDDEESTGKKPAQIQPRDNK